MKVLFKAAEYLWCSSGEKLALTLASHSDAENVKRFLDNMKDRIYDAELKEHREKRSLNANAYAWELITKIAETLTAEAQGDTAYSKDDVYLMMLKKYGQGGIVKVPNNCTEEFEKAWKYHEVHEKLWDEKAVYYRFWVGSSNYNTKEMSLFIDGIISDCKEQGIETMTPAQLELLKEGWGK